MLLGRLARWATARRGSASPDDRNAARMRDAWTTDLTRYGSRAAGDEDSFMAPALPCCERRNALMAVSPERGARSLEQSAIFVLFFCGLAACLAAPFAFRMPKRSADAGKPL